MKKVVLIAVLVSLLVGACGLDAKKCQLNWDNMEVVDPAGENKALRIKQLRYWEWPPNTLGSYLQECIREGWLPE